MNIANVTALGAVLLCLTMQAGLAMEPSEAGRQARQELDALIAKQRNEHVAVEKSADNAVPPPLSKTDNRRATKSIDNRVPTICSGC